MSKKWKTTNGILAAVAVLALNVGFSGSARADDLQQRRDHRNFNLGVCVGQTLSQEGVSVPFGEPTNEQVDNQTSAAIKGAVEACRAEMGVAPEPSASPSSSPTPDPSAS